MRKDYYAMGVADAVQKYLHKCDLDKMDEESFIDFWRYIYTRSRTELGADAKEVIWEISNILEGIWFCTLGDSNEEPH